MTGRSNVLFVVLDSARTDRVSAYGHDRETTPSLDALAEGATLYENAYTPAPWTLPSHCSMFTGAMPSEHGVTNGFTDRDLTLPANRRTVTQSLSDRGYRTAGFSNNPWVGQLSGLDRGFDRFVEWDLALSKGTADRRRDAIFGRLHSLVGRATNQPLVLLKRRFFTENLVTRACRWLRDTPEPTFTFLNLMEAHSPYYPPDWAFDGLGLDRPGPLEARSLNTKLLAYVLGKRDLGQSEQRRVHEFLDASLRYQDQEFDRLLTTLREQRRYEDTLVVVCADHGKTLGEFDREETPSHYQRDINVNVPLIVKRPGQERPERVTDPVELTDLFGALDAPDRDPPLPTRDHALVEDYLPHTGRRSEDVTRWRVLTDGETKYVRRADGEKYVLRATGTAERVVPSGAVDELLLERFRRALDGRVADFEGHTEAPGPAEGSSESAGEVDEQLESQLEDLGYLG